MPTLFTTSKTLSTNLYSIRCREAHELMKVIDKLTISERPEISISLLTMSVRIRQQTNRARTIVANTYTTHGYPSCVETWKPTHMYTMISEAISTGTTIRKWTVDGGHRPYLIWSTGCYNRCQAI